MSPGHGLPDSNQPAATRQRSKRQNPRPQEDLRPRVVCLEKLPKTTPNATFFLHSIRVSVKQQSEGRYQHRRGYIGPAAVAVFACSLEEWKSISNQTLRETAKHFKVSVACVSNHLAILNDLPEAFVHWLECCRCRRQHIAERRLRKLRRQPVADRNSGLRTVVQASGCTCSKGLFGEIPAHRSPSP